LSAKPSETYSNYFYYEPPTNSELHSLRMAQANFQEASGKAVLELLCE
jgi:hypothetical protein